MGITEGFQVVRADMFSHAYDPYVKFTCSGLTFNSTCISRLNHMEQSGGSFSINRQQDVELLLNPVERMIALRPCTSDHPNAFRWVDGRGKSRWISAKAFCTILFEICGWNEEYSYKVPAIMRSRGDETILFFDLDNFIEILLRKRNKGYDEETASEMENLPEERNDDTKGIFYAPDDDEPQEVTDTEEMERKLQAIAEYEKRNFGTPAFDHEGDVRLPAIDDNGEWEVMTDARVIGEDHRVDEGLVEAMQDEMMEAMIAAEDNDEGGTP